MPEFTDYSMKDRTYRYYTGTPLYPFGYGLSYTTFSYSNLQLSQQTLDKDEQMTVSATVKNTGSRAGWEIVQLYVHCQSQTVERPIKQLAGFARIWLEPGESGTVNMPLKHSQLAYFNEGTNTYDVEDGKVDIYVGTSSADTALTGQINVKGATVQDTYATAIRNIRSTVVKDGVMYDMGGQPVGPGYKGIVIKNGKKMVSK